MGVGTMIDTERKGWEVIIHDHDCDLWVTMVGGWMYRIVTGVILDVGVPSTYLVNTHLCLMPFAVLQWQLSQGPMMDKVL